MKSMIIILVTFYSLPAFAWWPNVATPPYAETQPLAKKIIHNGVPLKIILFKSPLSVDKVLRFYRDRWPEFAESRMDAWQQISTMDDGYFITVQVRAVDSHRSEGRINITGKPENLAQFTFAEGMPLPANTQVLQDTVVKDDMGKSRTVLASARINIVTSADFFRRHYAARGWEIVADRNLAPRGFGLIFRQGEDKVTVTIHAYGEGSSIMLNEVIKSGLF